MNAHVATVPARRQPSALGSAALLGTMRQLGPAYRYLIVGYPPFIKLLLDEGERDGFSWEAYRMHALLGGEGNSEALRDYLGRRFETVFSGYGATDVEIGLAAETPASIGLRRLAAERPEIARALFGEAWRSPMVFQYNPLLHHVETNANGELLVTVMRHGTLAPKVRYNVHDEGGVIRDDDLRARLADFGVDMSQLDPSRRRHVPIVELHARGTGPFAGDGDRIKHRYVAA